MLLQRQKCTAEMVEAPLSVNCCAWAELLWQVLPAHEQDVRSIAYWLNLVPNGMMYLSADNSFFQYQILL